MQNALPPPQLIMQSLIQLRGFWKQGQDTRSSLSRCVSFPFFTNVHQMVVPWLASPPLKEISCPKTKREAPIWFHHKLYPTIQWSVPPVYDTWISFSYTSRFTLIHFSKIRHRKHTLLDITVRPYLPARFAFHDDRSEDSADSHNGERKFLSYKYHTHYKFSSWKYLIQCEICFRECVKRSQTYDI